MFSYKERIKAVELLIKYDMAYSDVRKELGYPSKNSLRSWYKEYMENGDLHSEYTKKDMYSEAEKTNAVNYYLEHGKSISRTVKKLGYPCRPVLSKWIDEIGGADKNLDLKVTRRMFVFSYKERIKAVELLIKYDMAYSDVRQELGYPSKNSLRSWYKEYIENGDLHSKYAKSNLVICKEINQIKDKRIR